MKKHSKIDLHTEQVDYDAILRQARLDRGVFMRALCRGLINRLRGHGVSMTVREANAG